MFYLFECGWGIRWWCFVERVDDSTSTIIVIEEVMIMIRIICGNKHQQLHFTQKGFALACFAVHQRIFRLSNSAPHITFYTKRARLSMLRSSPTDFSSAKLSAGRPESCFTKSIPAELLPAMPHTTSGWKACSPASFCCKPITA